MLERRRAARLRGGGGGASRVAPKLSAGPKDDEQSLAARIFEMIDLDGSGSLDSRELRTAIAELHLVRVRSRLLLYSLRPERLSLPVGTIQVGIFRA